MYKLEEGIGDYVRPKNKLDDPGQSIQDGCKTIDGVRCRYVDSAESTREEAGCGSNKDVKMELDRIRNEIIRGTTKVGKYQRKCNEVEVVWTCIETRRRICGQEGDADGGAGEK